MTTRLKQLPLADTYRVGMLFERNLRLRAQSEAAANLANATLKEVEALMRSHGLNLSHQIVSVADGKYPLGAVLDGQGNPVIEEVPDAPQLTLVTPAEQPS